MVKVGKVINIIDFKIEKRFKHMQNEDSLMSKFCCNQRINIIIK